MAVLEDPNPGEVIVNLANLSEISTFCLPSAKPNDENVVFKSLGASEKFEVEPVGRWFEAYQIRKHSRHTNSCHSVESSDDEDESLSTLEEETEEEVNYLKSLDPKDWKSQDHYAVFGLKHKRFEATEAELKKAYRRKVLRHHPDKRRGAGEVVRDLDRDYFSCITKGYEILGNPTKRRAYDSVDPEFNDDIPLNNTHSKENFFKVFTAVFDRNSRWSNKKPVPKLGDDSSTVEDVDCFYQFWYDFDSWREFSYLDEEEKEKGENREERKWIEKQNKVARQKLKKEEMARIRQLTDIAYSCDPRIQRFKDEEKQRKLAQKQARIEAAKAKSEEEEKKRQEVLEVERKAKEKEEMEAKAQRDKERKEKEALKKQLKKERKTLQQICENDKYFTTEEDVKITRLQEVDLLCKLLPLDRLQRLNKVLQSEVDSNREKSFSLEVDAVNSQLQKEKEELLASLQRSSSTQSEPNSQKNWNHDDIQLLVKAVNIFPAGTTNRWEVVAAFINQHSTSGTTKVAKEALAKAKDLQKFDTNLKEEVNKKAYEKLEKSQKPVPPIVKEESTPTERFESPAEQQGLNLSMWTAEEQKLLEQALKTYPATAPDRWDKIAECLPGRSKKDCVKRYKDIVELIKAKKAAQAAAAAAKSEKK